MYDYNPSWRSWWGAPRERWVWRLQRRCWPWPIALCPMWQLPSLSSSLKVAMDLEIDARHNRNMLMDRSTTIDQWRQATNLIPAESYLPLCDVYVCKCVQVIHTVLHYVWTSMISRHAWLLQSRLATTLHQQFYITSRTTTALSSKYITDRIFRINRAIRTQRLRWSATFYIFQHPAEF